jgi:hypothetical protein
MWISFLAVADPERTGAAWLPYLVGGLIGVLSWMTFYFAGKPLGASTAYAQVAGMIGKLFSRRHTESLELYKKEAPPKVGWEVMLVAAVIVGALIAAWTGGEAMARWVPPLWAERFGDGLTPRLSVAFAGGTLMALGARIAGFWNNAGRCR